MKNSLCDLNDHLFVLLEGLMDETKSPEEIALEIKRANAVTSVAQTLINNANTQLNAMRLAGKIDRELPEMLAPKNTSGRNLIGDGNAGTVLD